MQALAGSEAGRGAAGGARLADPHHSAVARAVILAARPAYIRRRCGAGMWLAVAMAVASLQGDFDHLRRSRDLHWLSTAPDLWRMYVPAMLPVDPQESFAASARTIALNEGWGGIAERVCNDFYVGPHAAATGQLLVLRDGRWANTTLLMSGVGDVLTPADVVAAANGRRTNLCQSGTCSAGHDCVAVGQLPPVCIGASDTLSGDSVLLLAVLMGSVAFLIYSTWAEG